MDSHEYSKELQQLAKYLLTKPEFEVPSSESKQYFWYLYDKEGFIGAVKALGAGRKDMGDQYVDFSPKDAPINFMVRVEREQVCKLVRPAEYDCEPFLKPEDHKIIDAASQIPVDTPPF